MAEAGNPKPRSSPVLWSAVVAACTALAVVGIDTWLAQVVGIIRDGMPYDGVSYAVEAKALHRVFVSGGLRAWFDHGLEPAFGFAPLWKLLMAAHFGVLGEGLWQAYSVRLWPVFVLLFLTLWLCRRHGDVGFALFMAAVAVTLPTVSPNAISVLTHHTTGLYVVELLYLADLRPDVLYAILVVLAIAVLVESPTQPSASLMAVDGIIAACAVLVKSSTAPLTMCLWGIALLYFGWRRRGDRSRLWQWYGWAGAVFAAIVFVWGDAGGFQTTLAYLRQNVLGPNGAALWGLQQASLAQILGYYWDWFRYHMGIGVVVALPGLMLLHLLRPRTLVPTSSWSDVKVYAGLAVVLYALITVQVAKNYFLGLPAYLLVWVVVIILAAGVWRWVREVAPRASVAAGGTAFIVALSALASAVPSAQAFASPGYRQNLKLVQQLANDMRLVLSNNDKYMTYWTVDIPAILDFYMMDRQGKYPDRALSDTTTTEFLVDPSPVTRKRFVDLSLGPSKAIVMFEGSIEAAKQTVYVPRGGERILELVRAYLADPTHGMCAYRRYRFERLRGVDSTGGLTAVLYVRCSALALGGAR